MWKEPYNLQRLRIVCKDNPDVNVHPFKPSQQRSAQKPIADHSMEEHQPISLNDFNHLVEKDEGLVPVVVNDLLDLTLLPSAPSVPPPTDIVRNELFDIFGSPNFIQNTQSESIPTIQQPDSFISNEENQLCMLCYKNTRNAALYDCGHTCVCYSCGSRMAEDRMNCPVCDAQVLDCLKVFQS